MTALHFTKMHGLGNDFVVIDGTREAVALDGDRVRYLADRRRGVGCDQVLLLEGPRAGCDFGYRIFNGDGREVEHCGNGVRCVARYVHDQGLLAGNRATFATGERRVETRLQADGQVAVDMGPPDFDPAASGFEGAEPAADYRLEEGEYSASFGIVSMGNPHAVLAVSATATAPVGEIGPWLERHPTFAHGVNVGFLEYRDATHLRLRVWERGVGETAACGTGACAAAALARQWEWTSARVTVELSGGALVIDWPGADNALWMIGPAETVFHGHMPG